MISPDDFKKARKYIDGLSPEEKHKLVQVAMTDAELNQEFEKQVQHTKDEFLAKGEAMTTIFALARPKPGDPFELTMIAMPEGIPNDTKEEHDKYEIGIGAMIATEQPKFNMVALIVVSEIWGLKEKKGVAMPANFGKDPRRKEGLMVIAGSIDGRAAIARWWIERNKGKVSLKNDVHIPYQFSENPTPMPHMLRRIFGGYSMTRAQQEVK